MENDGFKAHCGNLLTEIDNFNRFQTITHGFAIGAANPAITAVVTAMVGKLYQGAEMNFVSDILPADAVGGGQKRGAVFGLQQGQEFAVLQLVRVDGFVKEFLYHIAPNKKARQNNGLNNIMIRD